MGRITSISIDAIFAAFPTALAIIKANGSDYKVEEVNGAFLQLTSMEKNDLVNKPFFETLNNYTADGFGGNLKKLYIAVQKVIDEKKMVGTDILEFNQQPFKTSEDKNLYLRFKFSPLVEENGEFQSVLLTVDDVTDLINEKEKKKSHTNSLKTRKELQNLTDDLATEAAVNKAQYESASQELDDFVYSVSHDLRAPLRRIDGFSQELLNEYAEKLDDTGAHYLKRIRQGAQDMGQLIDDLLKLSRISRRNVEKEEIDLGEIAKTVFDELIDVEPEREVEIEIDDDLKIEADKGLIKAMLVNLISNALKFTSKNKDAKIHIGSKLIDGDKVFYISDNGVGFDSAYSHKLFKAFSRLHSHSEFSGTGIGLATVKRIMTLHGGTIRAESPEGEGATFYFQF